jgi:hypothetical protein
MAMARLGSTQPLDVVAHHINEHLLEAFECQQACAFHRFLAGILLFKARKRIVEDGGNWEAWCKEHVPRSQRDIRKCIMLASAPDPQAAFGAERQEARERMRRIRAERAGVSTVLEGADRAHERPQPANQPIPVAAVTNGADRANVRPVPAQPKLVTAEVPVIRSDEEVDEILSRIARLREGQRARLFSKLRAEYGL